MHLNTLKPAQGARKARKRVGRGIGSTLGKTCGRGHKGQKSRSGGKVQLGFEGGQMPLQRRLPKVGFSARRTKYVAELRLHELDKIEAIDTPITLARLREAGLISKLIKKVKVIASGSIKRAVIIQGIQVTPGAKSSIEAAGGRIEN